MFSPLVIFQSAFWRSFFDSMFASDTTFGGFADLVQLIESYQVLLYIIGAVLFVVGILLYIFPGARSFLGSWFS